MIVLPRLIVSLLALAVLAGCASPFSREPLALPTPAAITCCWQSEHRAELIHDGQRQVYTLVMARQPERLTLVMLDALGRRLLTVNHFNDGSVEAQPRKEWQQLPVEHLLAAVYLLYTAAEDWPATTGWAVRGRSGQQALWYAQQAQLRVRPAPGAAPSETNTALTLHFISQQRVLQLTPKAVTQL